MSTHSTSAIGVRLCSFEPASPVASLDTAFLFSEECCDTPLDFEENFEPREVFSVDSAGRGINDFPLLVLDSGLVGGEGSRVISRKSLSMDMTPGRDLN